MNKMRLMICGMVLTLAMTGAAAYAANVLQPNTPSLTAPAATTTTTTTTVAPAAPTDTAPTETQMSKPADSLSLSTTPDVKSIDPKDIPDIVMKEMEEIQTSCERNYFYSSFHDCKCVAVKVP